MSRVVDTIDSASWWIALTERLRDHAEGATNVEERRFALEVAQVCVDFGMRRVLDAQSLAEEART